MKIWRGPKRHEEGLAQLADYLSIHSMEKGYLLIFDPRQEKSSETKLLVQDAKQIFAVWV